MAFSVYMLKCADGSFYVGHTDNLPSRLNLPNLGLGNAYTASRLPVVVIWASDFPTRHEALSAELQLKGWSRAKKQALLRNDWPAISRLAKSRPSTSSGRTVNEGGTGRTVDKGGSGQAGTTEVQDDGERRMSRTKRQVRKSHVEPAGKTITDMPTPRRFVDQG